MLHIFIISCTQRNLMNKVLQYFLIKGIEGYFLCRVEVRNRVNLMFTVVNSKNKN